MWSRDFFWDYLQCLQLLSRMSTFKQALKLTFGRKKFDKKTGQNLQTRIRFKKKSRDQVDKIIDQHHL